MAILLFITINCLAQTDTTIYNFESLDTVPKFPGGEDAMYNFIIEKQKEVKISLDDPNVKGIRYGVIVKFIIDYKGKVNDVKVELGSNSKELDEKVISLMKTMPKWKPAIKNGMAVNTSFSTPFCFVYTFINQNSKSDKNKKEILDKAMESFKKEVEDYFYNNGVKFFKSNQFKSAIYNFNRALDYIPDDIDALYNKSVCHIKLNENDKACETLKKIKELGKPDADDLIKKYCTN